VEMVMSVLLTNATPRLVASQQFWIVTTRTYARTTLVTIT
jgi:hypothetical protein